MHDGEQPRGAQPSNFNANGSPVAVRDCLITRLATFLFSSQPSSVSASLNPASMQTQRLRQ